MTPGARLAGWGRALVLASALAATAVRAQSCLGYSSLDNKAMNVSGAAHFYDGGESYSAQVNIGSSRPAQRYAFSVLAQANTYDAINVGGSTITPDNNMTFGGAVAAQIRNRHGFEWCPQVGVDYMTGNTAVLGAQGVLGIAKSLQPMGAVAPVPYLWGGVRYRRPDCDNCGDETYAVYGAGLGIRFGGGQQVTPGVSMTTERGAKPAFHVAVTFPVGRKA